MAEHEKKKDFDSERERLRLKKKLATEEGTDWEAQYEPGSFGCHELLDRTAMLAEEIERTILSHPACVRDPEWFALAAEAASALQSLYQRVGAEHMEKEAEAPASPKPSQEPPQPTPRKIGGRNIRPVGKPNS